MSAYIEIKTAWRAAGGNPEVTPTAERLLSSLRLLAKLREDAEQLSSENDRLQTRVSALHDVGLDLRAMVLGALTAAARFEDEEEHSAASDLLRAMGLPRAKAMTFTTWWGAVREVSHPLAVGTLVLSTSGESDCGGEPEVERFTGAVAVGQVIDVNDYVEQGRSYTVCFGNGTTVNIDEDEMEDADAYAVAPAPFIAPEGV